MKLLIKKFLYFGMIHIKFYWFIAFLANLFSSFFVTIIYILSIRLAVHFYQNPNITIDEVNYLNLNIFNVSSFFIFLGILSYLSSKILKYNIDKMKFHFISIKDLKVKNWDLTQARIIKIMLDLPVVFILIIILFWAEFKFGLVVICSYFFITYLLFSNYLEYKIDNITLRSFLDIFTILTFILMVLFFNIFDLMKDILSALICVFGTRLCNALFLSTLRTTKNLLSAK